MDFKVNFNGMYGKIVGSYGGHVGIYCTISLLIGMSEIFLPESKLPGIKLVLESGS